MKLKLIILSILLIISLNIIDIVSANEQQILIISTSTQKPELKGKRTIKEIIRYGTLTLQTPSTSTILYKIELNEIETVRTIKKKRGMITHDKLK